MTLRKHTPRAGIASTPAKALTRDQWSRLDTLERTIGTVTYRAKTPNPLNGSMGTTRGGRIARARERRGLRDQARAQALGLLGSKAYALPLEVELVRGSSGVLDDDGLRSALKPVRDGIADAIGVDDGDATLVRWDYDQRKAPRNFPTVTIILRKGARPE